MTSFKLTARQMQVIMMALYSTEEFADEAVELHDELVSEGFSRFEEIEPAKLDFRDDE